MNHSAGDHSSELLSDDVLGRIDTATTLLENRRIAVLTGAGISVDSGIPAYRGAGGVARTPMTAQMFLADEASRRRYWLGGHLGWRVFGSVRPNDAHRALVDMERNGLVGGVITQNVDSLHLRAGSNRVIELHGTMHRVYCLDCGQVFAREAIGQQIVHQNPWVESPEDVPLGPDGDVVPEATDRFIVPTCTVCGGMLRPDIVYFGETVPVPRFRMAELVMSTSDALVVAGTSLVVNSGVRIIERARRRGIPIIIVNHEPTRADAWSAVTIPAGTGLVLPELAKRLPGMAGRPEKAG